MLSFMWWLVIGLAAGALARFIVPGRQPMSVVVTIVLGLLGSVAGGWIASMIFGTDPRDSDFHAGGLIASTIGAVLLLVIYLSATKDRTAIRR